MLKFRVDRRIKSHIMCNKELYNIVSSTKSLDIVSFAFGSIVSEFLFLICVQKTISVKILVLFVINSSQHRKCFVRGCIYSLFVSKTLTRSFLARAGLS